MNGRRMAVALSLLAMLMTVLAACGGDDGDGKVASGNAGMGKFDPPSIETDVPEAVRDACDVSSPTIDRITREGVLVWAIGQSPPFGFKLDNGQWAGVEAQNAAELATILGVDFDIGDYQYDVLPQTVVTRQADIIGAQLFVTDDRRKVIDFSTPYDQAGQLFYVLEESPYRTIDDLNISNIRFTYASGGAQRELAEKYIPKARITGRPLRGRIVLYDILADGRADATMADAASMKVIRDEFSDPALVAIGLRGRVTGERPAAADILDPFDVAFGLPQGDRGWRDCVNAWVQDLLDSGRMDERLDYWRSQPVS